MYDTKLYLMVKLQFWRSGRAYSIPLLPLIPGPLGPGVVLLVRVSSRGQIDRVKNYSYLNSDQKVLRNNYTKAKRRKVNSSRTIAFTFELMPLKNV